MNSLQVVTTDDILLKLCHSVTHVLSSTSDSQVTHAGMVQNITRTCLKPDLGCFSIFDGGFSGLVVINFTKEAAIEIYRRYMLNMGMPESELAISHTSDDVANVMGELMNQILGNFIKTISKELQTSISQSQPKMLTINKELTISIDTNLDEAVSRRVTFRTADNHIFYLEFAMDKTEFIKLKEFAMDEDIDPDALIESHGNRVNKQAGYLAATSAAVAVTNEADDLLSELGL
ncbi:MULTISPECIES: DUF3334 family protein [unclassified Shewanella]|uniref:DUF3334 family protein n=1 Tax=unclassified Shewanella TaxID=196818 RepID=UPI000C85E97B|nr:MULTISPECIES: DUF3334 family protein [unclassified Shewanella]MDO6619266.1 DUF3334 family protein [Shewanella sp. 6_MG-2023]MDO6678926.1 DUF3334 family protein [Shewanella sp. 4_MG-2023]MDO6776127.1 DUF3334 family protein [Shewanella sp. 3_MG-2023]PMG28721.1 hypothetical protein BCU94_16100 [Shewanella sp. 10N.286.52.C2]PMG42463.1 hypothetical protein BCU91_08165 [Shewanella sp. 10N.286.52.B9]